MPVPVAPSLAVVKMRPMVGVEMLLTRLTRTVNGRPVRVVKMPLRPQPPYQRLRAKGELKDGVGGEGVADVVVGIAAVASAAGDVLDLAALAGPVL